MNKKIFWDVIAWVPVVLAWLIFMIVLSDKKGFNDLLQTINITLVLAICFICLYLWIKFCWDKAYKIKEKNIDKFEIVGGIVGVLLLTLIGILGW